MKTDKLFIDLKNLENIIVIENVNDDITKSFKAIYEKYNNKFFIELFTRCGGIIIDN